MHNSRMVLAAAKSELNQAREHLLNTCDLLGKLGDVRADTARKEYRRLTRLARELEGKKET